MESCYVVVLGLLLYNSEDGQREGITRLLSVSHRCCLDVNNGIWPFKTNLNPATQKIFIGTWPN